MQDVAIIGSGPAGSSLAIALKTLVKDLRVCLVDAQRFPRDKACGDGLGPGVHGVLTDLGLPHLLDDYPLVSNLVITGIKRYRIGGALPAVDSDVPRGRVVPRKVFDHRLRLAAADSGTTCIEGARLTSATFDASSHCWRLVFSGDAPAAIRARVLVGADGARSTVRRLLDIPFNSTRHTDIAIRSYVDCSLAESHPRALQFHYTRTLLPGYAWVFPIQHNLANIGLGISVLHYKARHGQMKDMLQGFFREWCAEAGHDPAHGPQEMKAYMLPQGSQLPPLAVGTAALVGDAGSMINPLTGEGVFYAMAGARILAQQIAHGLRDSLPFELSLKRYEQAFRARFDRHYATAFRLKRVMATPALSNLLLRACLRDRGTLTDVIEMLMGEGNRFRLRDAARILAVGLRP